MATINPAMAAPPWWSATPSFLEVVDTGSLAAPVEVESGAAVTAGALSLLSADPETRVEFS